MCKGFANAELQFQIFPSLAPEASLIIARRAQRFRRTFAGVGSQLILHIRGSCWYIPQTADPSGCGPCDEFRGAGVGGDCRMALHSPAGSLRVRSSGDSRAYLALSRPVAGAAVGPVWLPKYLFQRSWSDGEHSIS